MPETPPQRLEASMTQWLANNPMARRLDALRPEVFATTRSLDDAMAADDPLARRYEQRFSHRFDDSMTQWLENDQLDVL